MLSLSGSSHAKRIQGLLLSHPYISAFLACIILTPFCFGSLKYIPEYTPYAAWAVLSLALFGLISRTIKKFRLPRITAVSLAISASAVLFILIEKYKASDRKIVWIFFYGLSMMSVLYGAFYTNEMRRRMSSALIIAVGFWLKLCYVLCTNVNMRQHDEGWFSDTEVATGHLGYISYLFTNHHLYQGDYCSMMQYCHPPLHHTICAVWMHIMEDIFRIERDTALETMQMLTLFYSVSIVISAYYIFRHFKLEGKALYIPLMITSMHPCFTYLAALINNDALAWAFTMGAFLFTLRWYKEPSMKNIMKIALCIGLGMMSKLSAALIALPVAQVFLIVFVRKFKRSWKELTKQFAAFGAVCVPLGMWFPLRGFIRWKIPLTYVQELPAGMDQEIKGVSFFSRITNFDLEQVRNVFENWAYRDENGELAGMNETNPLIAILKNSVFGEFINGVYFEGASLTLCKIFFWVSAAIAFAAFAAMIVTFVKDRSIDEVQKLFTGIFYAVLVGNLYSMSANYPLVCTMNFRYLMPTVVTGALFIGLALRRNCRFRRVYGSAAAVSVSAFSLMSAAIYLIVCVRSEL